MQPSNSIGSLTPSNAQTTYHYVDDLDIVDQLGYDDVDDGYIGKPKDVEKTHQNRESHLRELFTSETNYVEALQLIQTSYLAPLRAEAKNQARKFLGLQKLVCTDHEVNALFSNIEKVYELHRSMLDQFSERFSRLWGPTQITWDIFQQYLPKLTVYEQYINNFSNCMETYQRLYKNQAFRKFIEGCQKDSSSKTTGLLQLLNEPMKRIDAYAEIISQIVLDTPPMHPDYGGLKAAKRCIQSIAGHFEERLKECDSLWQMAYLQCTIQNLPNIFSPRRRLILKGDLYRVNSQTQSLNPNVAYLLEPRTYLLFNDMLIYCKVKGNTGLLHYKGTVELRDMGVEMKQYQEATNLNVLELSSLHSMSDEWAANALVPIHIHTIRCSHPDQQQDWYNMLKSVLAEVNKTTSGYSSKGSKQTSSLSRTPTMTSLVSMNSTSTRSTKSTDDGYGTTTTIRTPSTASLPFDLQSKPKRSHDIVVAPSPRGPPTLIGGVYGGGFGLGRS
ncbi:hypothetical protein VKS41_005986 [Umbelopsis sp. WA50703]